MNQQDKFFRQAEVRALAENAPADAPVLGKIGSDYDQSRRVAFILTLLTLGVFGSLMLFRGLYYLSGKDEDDHMSGRGSIRGALAAYLVMLSIAGLLACAALILNVKIR